MVGAGTTPFEDPPGPVAAMAIVRRGEQPEADLGDMCLDLVPCRCRKRAPELTPATKKLFAFHPGSHVPRASRASCPVKVRYSRKQALKYSDSLTRSPLI